ncbi:MAG TPA: hypothetical protein VF808_02085 [Ktedonobacterales bacterium]
MAKARWVAGQIHATASALDLARAVYAQALTICERLGEQPYRATILQALNMLDDLRPDTPADWFCRTVACL